MRINGKNTDGVVLSVRMPSAEKHALKELAEEKGMSMSRLIQHSVRALVIGRAAFLDRQAERLGELTQQVLAVGRNLNQVARAVNRAKTPIRIDSDLLIAVQEEIKRVQNYLLELKKEEQERRSTIIDPELELAS